MVLVGYTRGLAVGTACHLHSVSYLLRVLLRAGHGVTSLPHPSVGAGLVLRGSSEAGTSSSGTRLGTSCVGTMWGRPCTINHYVVMSHGTQGDRMAHGQGGWCGSL